MPISAVEIRIHGNDGLMVMVDALMDGRTFVTDHRAVADIRTGVKSRVPVAMSRLVHMFQFRY